MASLRQEYRSPMFVVGPTVVIWWLLSCASVCRDQLCFSGLLRNEGGGIMLDIQNKPFRTRNKAEKCEILEVGMCHVKFEEPC